MRGGIELSGVAIGYWKGLGQGIGGGAIKWLGR